MIGAVSYIESVVAVVHRMRTIEITCKWITICAIARSASARDSRDDSARQIHLAYHMIFAVGYIQRVAIFRHA